MKKSKEQIARVKKEYDKKKVQPAYKPKTLSVILPGGTNATLTRKTLDHLLLIKKFLHEGQIFSHEELNLLHLAGYLGLSWMRTKGLVKQFSILENLWEWQSEELIIHGSGPEFNR